ncbi:MAG: SDR family NAD(P)-dependent oxidoreductase [Frankiaceae bacterium]|nr:SDR family NAD(P)-dependent oxidoreductase [Frankiaceae bacterium]MBV9872616.1 SDR family NAD(P)-dependent oxidoreductase [Frankiaceae bacterium]
MRLSGNSVIVTGGAGGLGEATCRALAAAGAAVVVADVADDKGKALADDLGGNATYVKVDVSEPEDITAAIAAAQERGPLRAAVTAHGGYVLAGRIVKKDNSPLELQGFRDTLEPYLTGTYNVMRLAAAAMAASEPEGESGRGVIVTTASIAGYEGQIGQVPYAAAKGGVIAMTLTAARDLAPMGIRVLTIAPGTFFTPAFGMPEEQATEHFGQGIPFPKRMGRPAEYGHLVESMIANDYLNGEVIRIDGAHRFGPR